MSSIYDIMKIKHQNNTVDQNVCNTYEGIKNQICILQLRIKQNQQNISDIRSLIGSKCTKTKNSDKCKEILNKKIKSYVEKNKELNQKLALLKSTKPY